MVIERALEKLKQENAAKRRRTDSADPMRHRPQPAAASTVPKPTFPHVPIDPAVADAHRIVLPNSPMEEASRPDAAYRMLRTRLLQKMRNQQWTTLAITSPGAGEGKSLSAVNLALSFSREKSRDVFLLDLDMRNPTVCGSLGVRPQRQIIDYFAGQIEPADVLFSVGVQNLTLAGGTTTTEFASELLGTDRLETLLDYIRSISASPVILLDLPPLLVTDEALLVAPRVDATILVVSEGRTRRDSLARAKQVLSEFTLGGVILNRSLETYGADGYYQYNYRYDENKG